MPKSTFRIAVGTMKVDVSEEEPQPLSALIDDCHIHGELEIRIGDYVVPNMGFFGPDDVCFSDWINSLDEVVELFEGREEASHQFDDGENDTPGFLFEREGDSVFLSLVAREHSGFVPDPQWLRVEFDYREFLQEVHKLKSTFFRELETASPAMHRIWAEGFLRNGLQNRPVPAVAPD